MKWKSKIWAGIGIVLVVLLALFMVGNQSEQPEKAKTISNAQTESKQDGEQEKIENGHEGDLVSENEDQKQTEEAASQDKVGAEENHAVVNENKASETSPPMDNGANAPSTENQPTGLYFSSREEAVAFGFSRFTAEEIAIYNRAAESGLTPEQEEMALQIAYSRFSPEEIAAIEEALGR